MMIVKEERRTRQEEKMKSGRQGRRDDGEMRDDEEEECFSDLSSFFPFFFLPKHPSVETESVSTFFSASSNWWTFPVRISSAQLIKRGLRREREFFCCLDSLCSLKVSI